jgi:APA family basic amino acid/polyamine antiporter
VAAALVVGTGLVTLVYVVTNLAYLYVLGPEGVRGTDSVAVDVAGAVFRRGGDTFVTLLVVVSTLGSIMGMIIGGSRVLYAMGRDRLFFEWVGRVHSRGTPAAALALLGILSAVYAALGTFEGIIGYFVFVSTIFLTMNVVSVVVHRVRGTGGARPFRIPLYPLPPLVYSLVAVTLLVQLLRENTRNALIGLAVVAASVPAYLVWTRVKRSGNAPRAFS